MSCVNTPKTTIVASLLSACLSKSSALPHVNTVCCAGVQDEEGNTSLHLAATNWHVPLHLATKAATKVPAVFHILSSKAAKNTARSSGPCKTSKSELQESLSCSSVLLIVFLGDTKVAEEIDRHVLKSVK